MFEAILLKLGRFSSKFLGYQIFADYLFSPFDNQIAKVIFSTLWVDCEYKLHILFKFCAKKKKKKKKKSRTG